MISRLNPVCRTTVVTALFLFAACTRNDASRLSEFAAPETCITCHEKEYAEWRNSHHDLAMQEATDQTVLGDFSDVTFTHQGVPFRFFKRDGRFFCNTKGPDGQFADFEITYTFGVEPLQQYLVPFPGGRLQCLPVAWDTRQKRWFHLYPDQTFRADDPLRWTGSYQTWNNMCAKCHSTNLRKNYNLEQDAYHTEWDVLDVSCQACHGPGKTHVEWARKHEAGEASGYENLGLVVRLKGQPAREVAACAPCHARRAEISDESWHGQPLLNHFLPSLLQEGLYYPDGQILDEVYVWGSFLQSKMYRSGVTCSDCHNPHSLKPVKAGNALCLQCHQQRPNERFPDLVLKNYDSREHHFHQPGTEAAQCVSCHMPARVYMVVDPRRDHSFRVPRPDLSVKLGTPNACNACHNDRSPEWAARWVEKWYGPKVATPPHYGEVLAAGRSGQPEAEPRLNALARDPQQPNIVRATAADLLRNYGTREATETLVSLATDPDGLIRAAAVNGLERLPYARRLQIVAPLLRDPVRAVRISAARVLASVPARQFSPDQRRDLEAAVEEFKRVQYVNGDQPGSHLNLGVLYEQLGQADRAEAAYRKALALDPYFIPARFNLANLYNRMGQNAEAESVLREGIERTPDDGELFYSLALVLAEEQRLAEAADALGHAAALLPDRARVRYNLGLVLQRLGRRPQAEEQLLKAHELAPEDADVLYALAVFYAQDRRWQAARNYARKLVKQQPNYPGAQSLLRQLEQLRGNPKSEIPNPKSQIRNPKSKRVGGSGTRAGVLSGAGPDGLSVRRLRNR